MPVYVFTTGLSNRLEETEYKIEFRRQSRKDGKFDGQIIITNLQEKKIEDWSMSFKCNFKIDKIWNAAFVDDYLEANANESYLNNGEIFWTSNRSNKKDAWFITEDGKLSYDKDTNTFVVLLPGRYTLSANPPYNLTHCPVYPSALTFRRPLSDTLTPPYLRQWHNKQSLPLFLSLINW